MAAHSDNRSGVRIDRWLWAARFFKTRSSAHQAIKGGKIERNDQRAKPSSVVAAGDRLSITKADISFDVRVDDVSERRGPASDAEQLYTEAGASIERRQREAEERRAARATMPRPGVRPDKKQRRELRRFKQDRYG